MTQLRIGGAPGTCVLHNGKWVIEAEPHIMMRLKRVFGSVGRRAYGKIQMSDTAANCRDLAWFVQRYPMEVTPRDHLENRAREHEERENIVRDLLAAKIAPREFKLKFPPRDYQKLAADVALRSGGLLLCDDLGLGKTVTAIAMLTEPSTRPALVVAPTHLQRQWRDEIGKFAPNLETHILKKGTPYDYSRSGRSNQLALIKPHPDVLITTYHKLPGWADTLAHVVKSVVYDEVQELRGGLMRNGKAIQKNAAAQHISQRVDYRLGLTATPI